MRTAATAEPRDVALITSSRNAGRTQLSMTKTVSSALLKLANQGTEQTMREVRITAHAIERWQQRVDPTPTG
jgi:hypothetical protein